MLIRTALLDAVAKWSYPGDDRDHIAVVAVLDGEQVATDGNRMARVPIKAPGIRLAIRREHALAAVVAQRALRTPVFDEDQRPAVNVVRDSIGGKL